MQRIFTKYSQMRRNKAGMTRNNVSVPRPVTERGLHMDKLLFYDALVSELKTRSLTGKIKAGAEERGNIAFLSEMLPVNENAQYLKECISLDDNGFCRKIFISLYDELKKQTRAPEERESDYILYTAADLMYSMGCLHDYVCIPRELFPEWFYVSEKQQGDSEK